MWTFYKTPLNNVASNCHKQTFNIPYFHISRCVNPRWRFNLHVKLFPKENLNHPFRQDATILIVSYHHKRFVSNRGSQYGGNNVYVFAYYFVYYFYLIFILLAKRWQYTEDHTFLPLPRIDWSFMNIKCVCWFVCIAKISMWTHGTWIHVKYLVTTGLSGNEFTVSHPVDVITGWRVTYTGYIFVSIAMSIFYFIVLELKQIILPCMIDHLIFLTVFLLCTFSRI